MNIDMALNYFYQRFLVLRPLVRLGETSQLVQILILFRQTYVYDDKSSSVLTVAQLVSNQTYSHLKFAGLVLGDCVTQLKEQCK